MFDSKEIERAWTCGIVVIAVCGGVVGVVIAVVVPYLWRHVSIVWN